MRRGVVVVVCLALMITANATTYYSVKNGVWNGSDVWSSVCSTCAGSSLPTLVDGDIVIIDDQVTILSGLVTVTAVITIIVRTDFSPNTLTNPAKLKFTSGGKIALPAGSIIKLENVTGNSAIDPQIDGTGSGASNQIDIGGVEYWRASEGDVIGVGILQPNGTLPITLLSFTAKALENSIRLDWITSMEKDFNYFEIQKATSSLDFSALTQTKGKGGMDVNTKYSYIDARPARGKNYYRLKSVDFDGTFKYSDVIVADWNGDFRAANVYPNPVDGRSVTIELDEIVDDPVVMSVVETRGLVVFQTKIESSTSIVDLPENLKAGLYIIQLQLGTGLQTIRIVVN